MLTSPSSQALIKPTTFRQGQIKRLLPPAERGDAVSKHRQSDRHTRRQPGSKAGRKAAAN